MPEYVYALHDFTPEHEDEIPFGAGDRIEVIEKDDMYGDGWWQGRNLFGKVGLFPQSYTTIDASVVQPQAPQPNGKDTNGSSSVPVNQLQTLAEESDVDSKKDEARASDGDGMMRATLTDVQEAIEQLGRSGIDKDGGGSFSFASTRDGDTTDRELDTDRETDNEVADDNANGWHKGGRSGLAEKARLQQQKQLEQEAALEAAAFPTPAIAPPPIEFELSDESEAEEEEDMHFPPRDHARIPEEDEEDEASARQTNGHIADTQTKQTSSPALANESQPSPTDIQPSEEFIVPEPDEADAQTATARQVSFPAGALPSPAKPHSDTVSSTVQAPALPYPQAAAPLTPTSPTSLAAVQSARSEVRPPLVRPMSEPELKKPTSPQDFPSPPPSQKGSKVPTSPPSEWSIEEVVEWAKSRGLDNVVCDKFIEHEISGDVLIELDEQILKTELEIHAFGKRKRIMKEIEQLRRPPSVSSSVQRAHSQTHSHSFSQSISVPGSAHHSLHSPMQNILSPESPPHTGDIAASPAATSTLRRDSDPGSSFRVSTTDPESTANNSMVGLGLGTATSSFATSTVGTVDKLEPGKGPKNRPAHLNLSPSENALNARSKTTNFSPKGDLIQDDRAALSDTESTRALDSRTKRRRMFGRSTGSAHSDSKDTLGRASTPTSTPGSPSTKRDSVEDGGKAIQRRKRSVDASKNHDRLSLFGGSISLGRARKPAPRVQSYAHDDLTTEKSSRSFSRLLSSGGHRRPSTRSQAVSELNGFKDDKEQNPGVLRKRTTSLVEGPGVLPSSGLRPGLSVLEQIGQPDHNGWMMKKGERYNTWKLRYFVLKGPHLYILESNSKALTKIKGYIDITGYKVIVDENVNPGRYGFRLIHDTEKTHHFSSDEQIIVREWMKALMKATIGRDYTRPVISSCNIPTIPLAVAQTMNPAPRPPSPSQRDATQKALRRENPNQLSTRDARILMGLPSAQSQQESEQFRAGESFMTIDPTPGTQTPSNGEKSPAPSTIANSTSTSTAPIRPSREARRTSVPPVDGPFAPLELIQWANNHLPQHLRISETSGQVYSALALYRLAEAVKGRPTEPPVPESAFPSGPNDDRLDGLFKLFDFFIDNDIRLHSNVSINDVRQGKRDKVAQIVRALKAWEDKRKTTMRSFNRAVAQAGPFMALEPDR